MQAGVTYFSSATGKTLRLLEANVMLLESEVRSQLVIINQTLTIDEGKWRAVEVGLLGFLSELTGGTFGSSAPVQDIPRCSRIVGTGSNLRSTLLRLRYDQLEYRGWSERLRPFGRILVLFLLLGVYTLLFVMLD